MTSINVIERATVPYNTANKVLIKDQYGLYAPAAGINKPGLAGFDARYFAVAEQIVRLNDAFLGTLVRRDTTVSEVDGIKAANTIYDNFTHKVIDYRDERDIKWWKMVTGSLFVSRTENIITEVLFAEGRVWLRSLTIQDNTVSTITDFEPLYNQYLIEKLTGNLDKVLIEMRELTNRTETAAANAGEAAQNLDFGLIVVDGVINVEFEEET